MSKFSTHMGSFALRLQSQLHSGLMIDAGCRVHLACNHGSAVDRSAIATVTPMCT